MFIEMTSGLGKGLQEARETSVAYLFHENTKLSPTAARRLQGGFAVSRTDLFLTSRPFKQIPVTDSFPIGTAVLEIQTDFTAVLNSRRSVNDLSGPVEFDELSNLIDVALGATAIAPTEEEGISQIRRSYPSAGGLYPLDTYIIARNVKDVPQGIYSFNVPQTQIEKIDGRDVEDILDEGFFWQSWISSAAAVIIFVGVLERTLLKYQDRGYRLVLLDAGHAGQNVLLAAHAMGMGACAIGGFNDNGLAEDLLIDGSHEVVVHAIAIGKTDNAKSDSRE